MVASLLAWEGFEDYLSGVCSGLLNVCLLLIEQTHK